MSCLGHRQGWRHEEAGGLHHDAPRTRLLCADVLHFLGRALLAIGGSGGMRGTTPTSDPRFAYALVAMLAGPSVTGIVLTALVHERAGVGELLSRLRTLRVNATWYAVALLTAPILMTATLAALLSTSPAFVPGIIITEAKTSLMMVGLAVGLSAGIFEELGWTGFAVPAVRKRHSVLATGFIVGVWWSAWHLFPNIWSSQAAAGELAMPSYLTATAIGILVGYLTAFRALMVWVYDRTRSLFLGMLMHASFTSADSEPAAHVRGAPRDLFLCARRRRVGRPSGDCRANWLASGGCA